jgi:hypothetical protein
MRTRRPSAEALTVLGSMSVEGNLAKITAGQLSRSLYLEVNECLIALGGKWNRKLGGHVFEDDPRDVLDQVVLTGGTFANRKVDFGFFESPSPVAERLVRVAGIQPGHRVLEPSAGRGALLRALAAQISIRKIDLTIIELEPDNCKALIGAGWEDRLIETDFLLYVGKTFDRVVMNPPFTRQADVDHVMHAYRLLAHGGRLVSVMSAGITYRRNRKTDSLRGLIKQHGAIENLPEHTFRESGTDVCTVIVTLDKPPLHESTLRGDVI